MTFASLVPFSQLLHIVSERSEGCACDFSMALHTGEDAAAILRNREMLARHFPQGYHFCGIRQTHSATVHVVTEAESVGWESLEDAVEADALITDLSCVVLTILTADCVPILLYDPVHHAIAAVHAGWRGTQQRIITKTLDAMQTHYGTRPMDVTAAIGPAIGACCYEVGSEVAIHFESYGDTVRQSRHPEKYLLDLKQVNALQLRDAGLLPERIETSPLCTACERTRFFSYRAEEGCSGRFVSAIAMR